MVLKSPWLQEGQFPFILWHTEILFEHFLKAEETFQEEHKQNLNLQIAKQCNSFLKFTHDQIRPCYGTRPRPCGRLHFPKMATPPSVLSRIVPMTILWHTSFWEMGFMFHLPESGQACDFEGSNAMWLNLGHKKMTHFVSGSYGMHALGTYLRYLLLYNKSPPNFSIYISVSLS